MTYPQGPYGDQYPPVPQQPPYPYPYPPHRRTNSTAIAALIVGLLGLVTGVAGFVAVPLGHIARSQIKRTGEEGAGMALVGLVLGYLSILLLIGALIFFFALFVAIAEA